MIAAYALIALGIAWVAGVVLTGILVLFAAEFLELPASRTFALSTAAAVAAVGVALIVWGVLI